VASASELARVAAWFASRDRRVAMRAQLEASMAGDPVAARRLQAGYQPLVDFAEQQRQPEVPEGDDSLIIANHDLNL
jgi:hypothetical protein